MDSLAAAREALRAAQAAAAGPIGALDRLGLPPIVPAVMDRYRDLTRSTPDGEGIVRRGTFHFDAEWDATRVSRGHDLIYRIQPGPCEDAPIFACLAYEAASIEWAWLEITTGLQAQGLTPPWDVSEERFSKFLFGTVPSADIGAFSNTAIVGDCTVVRMNLGLVDFVYQAAKAVTEVTNPGRTTGDEPGLTVQTAGTEEVIARRLDDNPAPVDRLYSTLEACFFAGYPRSRWNETVADVAQPGLGVLDSVAERFVLAHEYGHTLGSTMTGHSGDTGRDKEYLGDMLGMIPTVWSAFYLDSFQPDITLGAIMFVLACLDIRRRAYSLLLYGDETVLPAESENHPAPRDRMGNIIQDFRTFFDVTFHPDSYQCDLLFVPREHPPAINGIDDEDRLLNVYSNAEILQAVWKRAGVRLLEDRQNQRPLHPMWQLPYN